MQPMDIESAAIACQAVAGITQTAHLISLLETGVELEKAKKIVIAQIEDTAQSTAPELVRLLSTPGYKITVADMKAILLRAIKTAEGWMQNGPPPEKPFYDDPDGYHRHRCEKCLHVWEHENNSLSSPRREKPNEHNCPSCGRKCVQSFIGHMVYNGPVAPNTTTRK